MFKQQLTNLFTSAFRSLKRRLTFNVRDERLIVYSQSAGDYLLWHTTEGNGHKRPSHDQPSCQVTVLLLTLDHNQWQRTAVYSLRNRVVRP